MDGDESEWWRWIWKLKKRRVWQGLQLYFFSSPAKDKHLQDGYSYFWRVDVNESKSPDTAGKKEEEKEEKLEEEEKNSSIYFWIFYAELSINS